MASRFDEPDDYGSGAFVTIVFDKSLREDHPAKLIKKFISLIDISQFKKKYKVGKGKKGRAPKGIKMMLGVLLYAIYSRIFSAHKIDEATYTYSDFWIFTHKKRISHDKISDFINLHEDEIIDVFLATILLADRNDLLNFETLFQDGFFIKANASKHKNYNKKRLDKKEKKILAALEAAIEKLKEDRGNDEARLEKEKLEKKLEDIEILRKELNEKIKERTLGKRPDKVDENEVKINSTDKDSSLMKMKDKSYANAYLKITAVDSKADIMVGSVLEGYYDESHRSVQLFRKSNRNCNNLGEYKSVCFDSGFNTMGTCAWYKTLGVEVIAPTKQHENEKRNPDFNRITFDYNNERREVVCSEGKIFKKYSKLLDSIKGSYCYEFKDKENCINCKRLNDCTSSKRGYRKIKIDIRHPLQQSVLEKYKSEEGQQVYKKRSHVAETFQGDLKYNGKFDRFLRKGIQKTRIDSVFHDIVWNLRRIFNVTNGNIVWET